MGKHLNKKIAPAIVAICLTGYFILGAIFLVKASLSNMVKIVVIIVSIMMNIVTIAALVDRIKEIDKGDEDDLGKY